MGWTMSDVAVEHLYCGGCKDNVTVARFDGVAKVVCHCTHVDSDVDPVPLDDFAELPDRWHYGPQGRGKDSLSDYVEVDADREWHQQETTVQRVEALQREKSDE